MNFKQQLFSKNRNAMLRAFAAPDPKFNSCFLRVSAWFQQSTLLSKKNCELGNRYIIWLREMGKDNLENQVLIDRLDELHRKALDRIKRRAERKEKSIARGKRAPGRPKKEASVVPVTPPTPIVPNNDQVDRWKKLLNEETTNDGTGN